jgi:DNA-binding IclR family transcriptional regulator
MRGSGSRRVMSVAAPPKSVTRPARPQDNIQALERGLRILDVLGESAEGMLAKTISASTGLNISTCYHLLNTLVATGYAIKQPDQRFRLSTKLRFPSRALLDQARALNVVDAHLCALSGATHETAYLALRDGDDIVVVAARPSPRASPIPVLHVGHVGAGHAMALGKTLLADMPESEVGEYIERNGMEQLTTRTMAKGRQLLDELTATRHRGYAVDQEELLPGVCCVAAPISDSSNRVVGALGISTLSARFDRSKDRLVSHTVMSGQAATQALEAARLTLPSLGAQPTAVGG